jgi:hypothetical protein
MPAGIPTQPPAGLVSVYEAVQSTPQPSAAGTVSSQA